MKPLNTVEIEALVADCQSVIGAEAQELVGDLDCMTLKLWSSGLSFLVFQTKGTAPLFFATDNKEELGARQLVKADKKPLFIFYRSHFKGSKLIKIRRVHKYGRLVEFVFKKEAVEEELILEFRLFPGGVNLGLIVGSKKVYLNKPLGLTEMDTDYSPASVRSPAVVKEEWCQTLKKTPQKTQERNDQSGGEDLKRQKAKAKIKEALEFLETEPHKRFSESLQMQKDLPKDLKKLYRNNLSEQENIEWGFAKQKENKLKIKRLQERLVQLDEITAKVQAQNQKAQQNLKATRQLELSKGVLAFCGKTASENLNLLRKSKSWHMWMHLKDYPSGHLIIAFPKGHEVTEEELFKSALFLFKIAAPKKLHAAEQVKFEVIYTETKFVKPIKGAKKGLVQPQRTRSRIFLWKKSENLSF